MIRQNIGRASLAKIRRMKDQGALIESSNAPEGEELGRDFWAKAKIEEQISPRSVHLKLDPEVFDYFKQQGKGHLTRMQDVLKAYVKAHQRR